MSIQSCGSVPAEGSRSHSQGPGWHDGDYAEVIDSLIPMLCDEVDGYAEVCGVDAFLLLKDILEVFVFDGAVLSRPDEGYRKALEMVAGWLFEDMHSIALCFGVAPDQVMADVLGTIIADTPLADGFVLSWSERLH